MVDEQAGLAIVFNGEIYNFRELRSQLAPRHAFTTRSDTEVILNAYREWGAACVEHLRGMFSFAVWDERKRTLVPGPRPLRHQAAVHGLGGRAFLFCLRSQGLAALSARRPHRLSGAPRLPHVPVLSPGKNALPRRSRSSRRRPPAWSTRRASGPRPIGKCTTIPIWTIATAGSAIVARS